MSAMLNDIVVAIKLPLLSLKAGPPIVDNSPGVKVIIVVRLYEAVPMLPQLSVARRLKNLA